MAKRGRPSKAALAERARQTEIPMEGAGVARVHIPEIERLADAYAIARDKRLAAGKKESTANDELRAAMHEHASKIGKHPDTGELRYVYDGGSKALRVVIVVPTEEKLRVKDVEEFEAEDVT
jgi:hypothetical protein